MKSVKLVVLSTFLVLGVFYAAVYSSCTKDACKGVTCLNGCFCGGGVCNNPPKGVGGLNCEIIYRNLYSNNTYAGNGSDDSGKAYISNRFAFTAGNDSNYTKMQVLWTNPGGRSVNMPLIITNSSSTGSNFTVGPTTVDTVTYSGTGSVNSTVASMSLMETHPHSTPVVITLNNFNKQ